MASARVRVEAAALISLALEHPHTVPADGAVGVEVEGHLAFWTCDDRPLILVLTPVPPHTVLRGAAVCRWCCTNRRTDGGHHCSLEVCNGGVGSVRQNQKSNELMNHLLSGGHCEQCVCVMDGGYQKRRNEGFCQTNEANSNRLSEEQCCDGNTDSFQSSCWRVVSSPGARSRVMKPCYQCDCSCCATESNTDFSHAHREDDKHAFLPRSELDLCEMDIRCCVSAGLRRAATTLKLLDIRRMKQDHV
ncbi:hypothetical protein NFI96_001564 [Prochilodus magdalenae]|nr:hypothetical protein NFI96_001564 [Prochilodus magdalenae]